MGQYVDMETGEIIDVARFQREQARMVTRHQKVRPRRNRIYRFVREPEPQRFRTFLYLLPKTLWDKHYSELMGVLGLLAALVWWMWHMPS